MRFYWQHAVRCSKYVVWLRKRAIWLLGRPACVEVDKTNRNAGVLKNVLMELQQAFHGSRQVFSRSSLDQSAMAGQCQLFHLG